MSLNENVPSWFDQTGRRDPFVKNFENSSDPRTIFQIHVPSNNYGSFSSQLTVSKFCKVVNVLAWKDIKNGIPGNEHCTHKIVLQA